MLQKDFVIVISKTDLLDDELKQGIDEEFPENLRPVFISSFTKAGLNELKDTLWKKLNIIRY